LEKLARQKTIAEKKTITDPFSVEVFNLVFDCVYLMICRLIVDLGSRRKRFAQKVEEWRELQKKGNSCIYFLHTTCLTKCPL
jgi:hypothetical protein